MDGLRHRLGPIAMKPQLVVEFSDRLICAVLLTPEGQLLPCSQEIHGVSRRYLSSEILFDPRPSESFDFLWEEIVDALARATQATFFQRARRFGLWRPWDPQAPAEALLLSSPLDVLSSPEALVDPIVKSVLPGVAITLLDALLAPIFSFLATRKLDAREIELFGVIPDHIGRRARLALHKVFRRRGFRRLTLLSRPVAAAIAHLEKAPLECLVWDVAEDALHLTRVAIGAMDSQRHLQILGTRTAPGLGWSYWVRRIAETLGTPEKVSSLSRALMGLVSGSSDSMEFSASPPLRLSHELLREALNAELCQRWATELRRLLEAHIASLGTAALPVVLLGAACELAPLRAIFLSTANGEPIDTSTPILDQGSRGVGSALLWLRGGPDRRIEIRTNGSLRLDMCNDQTFEILPTESLPGPGEECFLRQRFSLEGDQEGTVPLLLHILWGSDASPNGNASLCALPLERDDQRYSVQGSFCLTVYLRRTHNGSRVIGRVEASPNGISTSQMKRSAFDKKVGIILHSRKGVEERQ